MRNEKMLYYPLEQDDGWNFEVSKFLPWLWGKCVDIGCGGRSVNPDHVLVDLDPELKPDIVASGDCLPFKDGEFNSLYALHVIEHIVDTEQALYEFLRVITQKGVVALVVPDRSFTGTKYPHHATGDQSEFMVHQHEWTHSEFMAELKNYEKLGFHVVDHGEALINWSFYVVLVKD